MRRAIITILLAGLCACGNRGSPHLGRNELQIVYVSPTGNDGHQGGRDCPMRTLSAVSAKLKREAPDADVEVRCISNQGTYWNQFATWDYWNSAHATTITSYPTGTRARFEMADSAGSVEPFFKFTASAGEATNLRIENLLVVNYNAGAIHFLGTWPDVSPVKWNGYNKISNCIFASSGNYGRADLPMCYGVLDFVRSVCDTIEDNIFYRCENANSAAPIIGIYLAHNSRGNVIRDNLFRGIAGNTIKLRDASNGTLIENNTFIRSGWEAMGVGANVISWYCDENLMELDCSFTHEDASDSTVIQNNVMRGMQYCSMAIPWADFMLTLAPCMKCNPCVGDTSHVTLSGNSCDTCQVSDYWENDITPY